MGDRNQSWVWLPLKASIAVLCGWAVYWGTSPVQFEVTAERLQLPDGRFLAYSIFGADAASAKAYAFAMHGNTMSRLDDHEMRSGLYSELGLRVISIDRPGWGQSSPNRNVSYKVNADDVVALADHLGIGRFLMIGFSAGGPNSLAVAWYHPDRVRGAMLVGSPGSRGLAGLTPEERKDFELKTDSTIRVLLKGLGNPVLDSVVKAALMSRIGSRLLYQLGLRPVFADMDNLAKGFPEADKRCVLEPGTKHMFAATFAEGFKQHNGHQMLRESGMFTGNWGFKASDIDPDLQRAIHIWHGTDDNNIVPGFAKDLKRQMPKAHLHMVEGAGHLSLLCDHQVTRRHMLENLLKTAQPVRTEPEEQFEAEELGTR